MVGNRRSLLALVGVVCILAFASLFAPSQASAQVFDPESYGANDYCAVEGPMGRGRGQDAWNNLTINVADSGTGTAAVYPRMWGTQAPCINPPEAPQGATCVATSCTYAVQTVCEFHCFHDHSAPFHWTVALIPQQSAGANFLRWENASCAPIKDAPRSYCVVRMSTDQSAVAVFGATADTALPEAPTLSAAPGSYDVALSWTPSTDVNLGGYEVFKDGTLLARLPRSLNTTSYRVGNVFCDTGYSFQVKAYDFSLNESASNVVPVRTGRCAPTIAPRPNTVIHVKPPKSTRSRTAFFHYGQRGDVRATKYQCKLDRGAWTKCSGVTGKHYRNLRVGLHTFRVRAGNAAGYDATPATYTWRIRR